MSSLQNHIKTLLRGGKHAKANDPPKDQPTTTVDRSNVHASREKQQHGISEPVIGQIQQKHYANPNGPEHVSVGAGGHNQNLAANAGGLAAGAAGQNQKIQTPVRDEEIKRIVAEERAKANQLPKYPGLERYILREKMGDGAFSNVYRARDSQTGHEVAIKVVRKFEMNSNQVGPGWGTSIFLLFAFDFLFSGAPNQQYIRRAMHIFIRTSRSNPKLWRCASSLLSVLTLNP